MSGDWHIDSLDPRGGIAFASRRSPDLCDDSIDLDLPAVLVAPPAFVPETAASRSVGLAATRGSFQLGLFLDGEEIAFPTLESLVEFVRRTYVAGGGGDGGNGVGPLPPPPTPPDESGSERGRRESIEPEGGGEKSGAIRSVFQAAELFTGAVEELDSTGGAVAMRVEAASALKLAKAGPGDAETLADAAALLISELFLRSPKHAEPLWIDAIARLGAAIDALSLWGLIADRHGHRLFFEAEPAAKALGDYYLHIWHRIREEGGPLGAEVISLFGATARRDVNDSFYLYRRFGWPPLDGSWSSGATDPMDDLSLWPVPDSAKPSKEIGSLRELLCALTAQPQWITTTGQAGLLLLAAVHLTSAGWTAPAHYVADPLAALRDRAVGEALRWLGSQFPSHAYRPALEQLFGDAIRVKSVARADAV